MLTFGVFITFALTVPVTGIVELVILALTLPATGTGFALVLITVTGDFTCAAAVAQRTVNNPNPDNITLLDRSIRSSPSWQKPSLTLIKDTTLGTAPFAFYYPKGSGMMVRPGPNGPVTIDLGEAIGGVMQEQFDAVLYLGPKTEIAYCKLPKSPCADPEYVEMRASRLSAMRPPGEATTGPSPAAEDFRMRCKEAAEGPRTIPTPGIKQ